MRRKNGYTLTEILVVILLLAVVGGIIIFNVNSILNKNKAKSYDRFIANVKSSAETYASLNLDKVNDLYENKSFTYITAGELIDNGFLDEKTTNPYTNQRIGRDELIKLSLSTETGDLTVTYPATEENKEVFLSSVVLSTTVGKEVNCMEGIGTYTLALSDETGKLILDKNTLINDYSFKCKLPDSFNKRAGDMNNELGSTEQVGTYEIEYYWVSKSGTKGSGKRFLKVVPDTVTITYDVDVLEGNKVDEWTNATCVGKISTVDDKKVCTKEVLVGYNYNTLSRPTRTGYNFAGWYREKQADPENPGNGLEVTSNNKVVEKTSHTIYAHWDRKRFGVTLDSTLNGRPAVEPGTTNVIARYNVPLQDITIPKRYFDVSFNLNDSRNSNGTTEGTSTESVIVANWDFGGYTTAGPDPKIYIDSEGHGTYPWTELSDTTLYSIWSNGLITLPDASRPGYTFDGWFTENVDGTKRDNNYQYEVTTELFAHWTPKTYKVTLDYNTDDGGSTRENETKESINQVFDNNFDELFYPTRNGYTFLGWFTEDNKEIKKETRATNEYKIIDNNGLTLRAEWEKNKYDLKLEMNRPDDMTYDPIREYDDKLKMTFDEPTNNTVGVPYVKGWNFLGWYTSDNVQVYNADGTHNTSINTYFDNRNNWIYIGDVTLYAHWEQKTYTLSIDLKPDDKMSFAPTLSDGTENYSYTMTFDSKNNNHIPYGVLAGWKFLGWYDESGNLVYDELGTYIESTTTEYFKNGNWNYENDLSLHAEWEQKPITVILDKNDTDLYDKPTLEKDAYVFTYDDPIESNIVIPSFLDGYEFLGWYDGETKVFNADGSIDNEATSYFNGNKWIKPEGIVLKAKWKANGYVVTLNQPDATKVGTESISINYNSQLPNITIPERKYAITYDVDDTEGSTRSTEVANIVKEWHFDGYYTDSNNEYYNESGETTIVYHEARDIDLYAKWSNGTLEDMPQPTRVGYDFGGWYTSKEYNTKIENGYTVTEDMTLYAKWIAKNYTITLDNNKASVEGTTSLPVTFDKKIDNITAPIKIYTVTLDKGYEVENREETKQAKWDFKGYYTQPDGMGSRYFDADGNINQAYTLDSDLTLYAYYEGGTITLPEYRRDDYIFQGWYDGSRQVEETDTYEENKTIKIHWKSVEYNLTLRIGTPSYMTSSTSVEPDAYKMAMHTPNNNIITVPTPAVGWDFLGWYDTSDVQVFNKDGEWQASASDYFDSEGKWIKRDDVTLYGHWEEKAIPFTLNSGNDDPSAIVRVMKYDNVGDVTVPMPDHYFGHAFDGYFLDEEMIYDSSGNRVDNNSVFTSTGKLKVAEAITLEARWSEYPNMLQLTVNMLSGMQEIPRLANSKYEMAKDSAVNNMVNVPSTIPGFDFLGWYDGDEQVFDSSGMHVTSSYFDASGKWLKDDGASLQSKYERQTSTINLNDSDGKTTISRNTFTAVYGLTDPENVAVPEEIDAYEFKGWYYNSTMVYDEYGNKNLSASAFFGPSGEWLYIGFVELMPKWERKPIKLTLDVNADPSWEEQPTVRTIEYGMMLDSTANNIVNVPSTIEGHTFTGWYDETTQVFDENGHYNSSASTFFDSEGRWVRETSVTLKARWV